MGTLSSLVPLLGILIGAILPKLTLSEIKKGKPYFLILLHVMFGIIAGTVAATYNIWFALIGLLVFAFNWKLKISYPTYILPFFAILVILYPFLSIPVMLLFLPLGTIHNKEKTRLFVYSLAYVAIIITFALFITKPI